jgi:hypothetical protein
LEAELDSPVLSYVTGDRPGLQTQIASDQLILFPRHLASLDESDELNLLLYTRGGETAAAWPIVGFLREHAKKVRVLVPFYAHSAGTLISLGADEIIMARYATLSPIDPSVANAFNPQDPANPANKLQIAVEDVMAYLQLATANGSADDAQLRGDAFRKLAESVHPLALGNVQRSINQIKQLARKMLALHEAKQPSEKIDAVVTALTTQLYSHSHLVNRREAREIGLPIAVASTKVETLLSEYYEELCVDLELRTKFDPAAIYRAAVASGVPAAGASPVTAPTNLPGNLGVPGAVAAPGFAQGVAPGLAIPVKVERGYLETVRSCDAYTTEGAISQVVTQQPMPGLPMPMNISQVVAMQFQVLSDDWVRAA